MHSHTHMYVYMCIRKNYEPFSPKVRVNSIYLSTKLS